MPDPEHEDYDLFLEEVVNNAKVSYADTVGVFLAGKFDNTVRKRVL